MIHIPVNVYKYLLTVLFFIYLMPVKANLPAIHDSKQIIVVTNSDPKNDRASLSYYEHKHGQWLIIGEPITVVVGRNGITQHKKEGDGATPSGIFSLGTSFGFAAKPDFALKLPYLPITKTTVCVDDVKSTYYNKIIDSDKVVKASWNNSGEQMREKVPQYIWGLVVNYNLPHAEADKGSCIFMHIWTNSQKGTAGCIAMSDANIKKLLHWIDPDKKPRLIIASSKDYQTLSKLMQLPVNRDRCGIFIKVLQRNQF